MKTKTKKSRKYIIIIASLFTIIGAIFGVGYNYLSTYEKGILPPFESHNIEFTE